MQPLSRDLSRTLPRLPLPQRCARKQPLPDGYPRPPPAAPNVFVPILVRHARPCLPHPSSSTAPVLVRRARPRSQRQSSPPPVPSAAPSHSARQLRPSAAPVDRARRPRPSAAPDLVPTTTRPPVHCVATRRCKIRSTFQNKNKACMKNKTYPGPPTSARCRSPCAALVGEAKQKMVKPRLEEGQKSDDSPHLPRCAGALQEQPLGIIAVYLRRSLQNEGPKRKMLVRFTSGIQTHMK